MRKLFKALVFCVALIAFTALSMYAYLSVLDPGQFRDEIAKVVKSSTGRDLAIKGEVNFIVFPSPRLLVEGVSLSNASWGIRSNLMKADTVVAELALLPLFYRTISIKRMILIRPELNLEKNARGESNWNLWESKSSSPGSSAVLIDVSNVDVRNARVSYLEHGAGDPTVLKVQKLRLRSKGFLKPVGVSVVGRLNKHPFRIRGETGSLASLFSNRPVDIDLKISTGGVVLTLIGGLKQPMEFRGLGAKLTVSSRDFGGFLSEKRSSGAKPVVLSGQGRVRDRKNRIVVDRLELAIGESDLAGSISFGRRSGRQLIRGNLASKLLDVDAMFPKSDKGKRSTGARLIPGWTFPVSTMRSFDTDINFNGRHVVASGMDFRRLKVHLGIKSGRMEIKPRGKLYGGALDGRIELDVRAGTPRLLVEIRGTDVNMGSLLNAAKSKRVMSGAKGQLYIKLEGSGHTPRAVAASMNGRFLTSVGPGQIYNSALKILGTDALMQFVRSFDPADKTNQVTVMQCGVIFFDVKKGIATTDRGIAAETKRMNVIGSGTINLGSEAIDLALRAQPRDGVGLSASTLGNVVRISGTLAAPDTGMDAVGALKTGASVGAAVVTSGISLLVQGLFNRVTADSAPCKTALKVKRGRPKASPAPTPGSPSDRG
ncbi:MAG: AsmA family protein [Gammaproteobacteria bacterium]|nr:AsmA family protein [Gammaproteobacteria bacterium]